MRKIQLTEREISLGWVISTAHAWLQKLPLTSNVLVCRDCGVETKIGNWNIQVCHEQVVSI